MHSFDLVDESGRGTIYSYTVNRRGQGDCGTSPRTGVRQVEKDHASSPIVDCDFEQLGVGQAVEVVFHTASNGAALPASPTSGH
jgi:uncharacterized OB-fold protein